MISPIVLQSWTKPVETNVGSLKAQFQGTFQLCTLMTPFYMRLHEGTLPLPL